MKLYHRSWLGTAASGRHRCQGREQPVGVWLAVRVLGRRHDAVHSGFPERLSKLGRVWVVILASNLSDGAEEVLETILAQPPGHHELHLPSYDDPQLNNSVDGELEPSHAVGGCSGLPPRQPVAGLQQDPGVLIFSPCRERSLVATAIAEPTAVQYVETVVQPVQAIGGVQDLIPQQT